MKKTKTYIVPNWYGFIFGISILAAILLASTYSNNLIYMVAFFMLGLFLLAMVQANANLNELYIDKINFSMAEENSRAKGSLWLRNDSNENHYQVRVHIEQIEKSFNFIVEECPKKSTTNKNFSYPSQAIGIKPITRIKISSVYPLGLFYVWRTYQANESIYTYPKPEGKLSLPLNNMGGDAYVFQHGQSGEDFSEHARFEKGENYRHVDWKAFARGRPLMLKKFNDGDRNNYILDIKSTSGAYEQRLRQMSKWLHYCYEQHLAYSVYINEQQKIEFGYGHLHKSNGLRLLAMAGEKHSGIS